MIDSAVAARFAERTRARQQRGLASAASAAPTIIEPPEDIGKFVAQLTLPVAEEQTPPHEQRAEEMAAVSGRFDPQELVVDLDPAKREAVLNHLAPSCLVDRHREGIAWLLDRPRRHAALDRLRAEGRLQQLLAGPLVETDSLGLMLREVLTKGADVPLDGRRRDEILDLLSVLELLTGTDLPQPNVEQVRARQQDQTTLAEYAESIGNRLVGRKSELATLEGFLLAPRTAHWDGLVIAGLGGAGKSAVLAYFAQSVEERQLASVVVFDFDRPGIDASDSFWLVSEMSRQIGQQYPQMREVLRQERRRLLEQKASRGFSTHQANSDSSAFERGFTRLILRIADELTKVGAAGRPILIVLDTFEEVTQRGLDERMIAFLDTTQADLHSIPLKVIFSGRLFDMAKKRLPPQVVDRWVDVGELAPDEAVQLLEQEKVARTVAEQVVASKVLPLRPLELKLIARILRDTGSASDNLVDIGRELAQNGPAAAELFAGLIYRRVLQRISNETVRQLAHPGLVLRYVDVDLVIEVLVPAAQMRPLGRDEAQAALDDLALHEWLATRATDGKVWHRADIRRSMLKVMLGGSPQTSSSPADPKLAEDRAKARRVSEGALTYFQHRSGYEAQSEAAYHALLMAQPEDEEPRIALDVIRQQQTRLLGLADDFPPAGRALLVYAQTGSAPEGTSALLPVSLRADSYFATGEQLVRHKEFGKARDLIQSFRGTSSWKRTRRWEQLALFATARWDEVRPTATRPATADMSFLQYATELLYPQILIDPETVDYAEVSAAIDRALERKGLTDLEPITKYDTDPEHLTLGLVMLRGIKRDSKALRELAQRLEPMARLAGTSGTGAFVATGGFVHRTFLLGLHRGAPPAEQFRLGKTLATLDLDWLALAQARAVDELGRSYLATVRDRLVAAGIRPRGERLTVRDVLSSIDTIDPNDASNFVELDLDWLAPPRDLTRLLRGCNPEFRDPTRFALIAELGAAERVKELAKVLRKALGDFSDLAPDEFQTAFARNPEECLREYVEYADRADKLAKLLGVAHASCPDSRPIAEVRRAYKMWTSVVARTVRNTCRAVRQPKDRVSEARQQRPARRRAQQIVTKE